MKESLAAIQAKTVRTPEEQQTIDILQKDVAADESVIRDAINKLATLLGDNTTAGSIREWRVLLPIHMMLQQLRRLLMF
jgi:hypothetical protein